MTDLSQRLAAVLAEVLTVNEEADGALTVSHDGTLASLRTVSIADGLELVSLNQVLAWDLPLTKKLRDRVTERAQNSQFGTVVLVEKSDQGADQAAAKTADVLLRYNFPGAGLADDALRILVLLVLDAGAETGRAVTAISAR